MTAKIPYAGKARPKGFAAMDPEKQREIARKGGKSVDPKNRTFSLDREMASACGRKGGIAAGKSPKKYKHGT